MAYAEKNYGPATLGGPVAGDAPRAAELHELHATMERAVKSAGEACAVLGALRDRLFGDRPQSPDKAMVTPMRGGVVGALHDRSEALHGALDHLHSLLNEITRVA